jgi:hypothetical protein
MGAQKRTYSARSFACVCGGGGGARTRTQSIEGILLVKNLITIDADAGQTVESIIAEERRRRIRAWREQKEELTASGKGNPSPRTSSVQYYM